MVDLDSLVRKNILELTPYSSARDEFSGKEGIFLDANESPFGNLNRYPDPYQLRLKKEISKLKNVYSNQIFLGNGSDEAIDLLFRVFCTPSKDSIIVFTPTYGMYQVAAAINDIHVIEERLDDQFQINLDSLVRYLDNTSVKLIFICSPNNPSGNLIEEQKVVDILERFNGIVVIDEAYIDFSDSKSFLSLFDKYLNLVVLQTFSKAWGMAGVRLGMLFANERVIRYLNKVKPPYNISSINQSVILERIKEKEKVKNEIDLLKQERNRLIKQMMQLPFVVKVYPSNANFILINVQDADSLYSYLITKKIVVRNRDKIIKNHIRITVGNAFENDQLLAVMKEFK